MTLAIISTKNRIKTNSKNCLMLTIYRKQICICVYILCSTPKVPNAKLEFIKDNKMTVGAYAKANNATPIAFKRVTLNQD